MEQHVARRAGALDVEEGLVGQRWRGEHHPRLPEPPADVAERLAAAVGVADHQRGRLLGEKAHHSSERLLGVPRQVVHKQHDLDRFAPPARVDRQTDADENVDVSVPGGPMDGDIDRRRLAIPGQSELPARMPELLVAERAEALGPGVRVPLASCEQPAQHAHIMPHPDGLEPTTHHRPGPRCRGHPRPAPLAAYTSFVRSRRDRGWLNGPGFGILGQGGRRRG